MRLDYQRSPGAEACPDADAWRDAVVSKIEGAADPFNEAGSHVLRVVMERRAAGYRATFEVFDASGRSMGAQEQTAATCPEAARALAVGASLLFVARPTAPPPQTTTPTIAPPRPFAARSLAAAPALARASGRRGRGRRRLFALHRAELRGVRGPALPSARR
jgi:hypothetical protein